MPLPFLTADRALQADGRADPVPPSDLGPDHWRRPYRPGPWRVGTAAVFLLLASFVLLSALIIALAGAPVGAAVCAAVGICVRAQGLRQANLLRTTTLPWSAVAAVRTVQQPVRWLGLPRTVQGQALRVDRASGEPLRVLVTDHNGDFLGRAETFESAVDALEAWAAEYR